MVKHGVSGSRIFLVILAAFSVALACGADAYDAGDIFDGQPATTADAAEPTTTEPTATEPTATEPTATEPTATEPPADDGAAVYQRFCAECHGVDLRGTDEGPSQLSILYEPNHHGDFAYRVAIREGVRAHHWGFGDMAPVEGITDLEIERVIAFIRSEQERLGFEQ